MRSSVHLCQLQLRAIERLAQPACIFWEEGMGHRATAMFSQWPQALHGATGTSMQP